MKKFLAAAAAVTLASVAAPAFAQTIDGSIGYSSFDVEGVDLGAVTGRLSFGVNDVFGIEAEASIGVSDETATVVNPTPPPANVTGKVELNYAIGVFGTAGVPLGDGGRLFARVGYATGEVEASVTGVGSASGSDSGFAYGVGGQFMIAGPNGIRVDYTKYDFDDAEADVWSISYVRRFR